MKLESIPEYCDLIAVNEFDPYICSPDDGVGYWATEDKMSDISVFNWDGKKVVYSKSPEWATHIAWFNK